MQTTTFFKSLHLQGAPGVNTPLLPGMAGLVIVVSDYQVMLQNGFGWMENALVPGFSVGPVVVATGSAVSVGSPSTVPGGMFRLPPGAGLVWNGLNTTATAEVQLTWYWGR